MIQRAGRRSGTEAKFRVSGIVAAIDLQPVVLFDILNVGGVLIVLTCCGCVAVYNLSLGS